MDGVTQLKCYSCHVIYRLLETKQQLATVAKRETTKRSFPSMGRIFLAFPSWVVAPNLTVGFKTDFPKPNQTHFVHAKAQAGSSMVVTT